MGEDAPVSPRPAEPQPWVPRHVVVRLEPAGEIVRADEEEAPARRQAARRVGDQRPVVGHVLEHVPQRDCVVGLRVGAGRGRVADAENRLGIGLGVEAGEPAAGDRDLERGEVEAMRLVTAFARQHHEAAVAAADVENAPTERH